MSQHDQVLDNANGLTFRTDLNAALAALFTASSGATEPTTKVPGQLWFDTSTPGTNQLKLRDQTNAFWILLYSLANEAIDEQMARFAAQENILINGGFGLNQAGSGAVASINGSTSFCDGWKIGAGLTGASAQQMSIASAPPGLRQVGPNRARFTVQTAKGSLAASDYLAMTQAIEGTVSRHLGWGLAGGKPAALRFGIKAPAGTYGVSIISATGGASAPNWMGTFTVAAGEANTDKIVVLQIPAPSAAGAWDGTTALAMTLRITLAAGTTFQGTAGWGTTNLLTTSAQFNGFASTSNVFELFDVKLVPNMDGLTLDPGFAAWDHTKETLRCQRYYQTVGLSCGLYGTAGAIAKVQVPFPTPMRAVPTSAVTTAGTLTNVTTIAPSADTLRAIFDVTVTAAGIGYVDNRFYGYDARL